MDSTPLAACPQGAPCKSGLFYCAQSGAGVVGLVPGAISLSCGRVLPTIKRLEANDGPLGGRGETQGNHLDLLDINFANGATLNYTANADNTGGTPQASRKRLTADKGLGTLISYHHLA
jgi:hypothetical protein